MNSNTCVFCIKDSIIEDSEFLVFYSSDPQAQIHVLICPKIHMMVLDDNHWNKIYNIVEKVKNHFNVDSYSLHMNFKAPRQTIMHSHLHFLAGSNFGKNL